MVTKPIQHALIDAICHYGQTDASGNLTEDSKLRIVWYMVYIMRRDMGMIVTLSQLRTLASILDGDTSLIEAHRDAA